MSKSGRIFIKNTVKLAEVTNKAHLIHDHRPQHHWRRKMTMKAFLGQYSCPIGQSQYGGVKASYIQIQWVLCNKTFTVATVVSLPFPVTVLSDSEIEIIPQSQCRCDICRVPHSNPTPSIIDATTCKSRMALYMQISYELWHCHIHLYE